MSLIESKIKPQFTLRENFRMACIEELGAQNTYIRLKELIKEMIPDTYPEHICSELLSRVEEIIKDEEEHLGSLLYCLDLIDRDLTTNMQAGVHGN